MLPTFNTHLRRVLLGSAAVLALGAGPAGAVTIDFRNAGGSYGYGNTLQFTAGGITVDAYAWAETGALQSSSPNFWYFQTAELYSWATGIGICNRVEGSINSGCGTDEHEIDTAGSRDDLLVLYFDQLVSFDNLEVTVDPWDGTHANDPNDRDIRYWISTVGSAPDLSTYSFNTLSGTFGASTLSSAPSSYNIFTHMLYNGGPAVSGNLLLLSGNFLNRSCTDLNIDGDSECEAWKLKSIVVAPVEQVVPVPAAAWLLGSALGGLAWLRRRAVA